MIEPMTARDLLTVAYAALVVFGGLYLLHSIPFLWEHYSKQWKQSKRKRKP
jgi:hypothetical protein